MEVPSHPTLSLFLPGREKRWRRYGTSPQAARTSTGKPTPTSPEKAPPTSGGAPRAMPSAARSDGTWTRRSTPPWRARAGGKIPAGFPAGVVPLRGADLRTHRDEILRLVRNEEGRSRGINPLERIMEIREGGDGMGIPTTAEKPAPRA